MQAILIMMSLALSYAALTGLSMAMPRHYAQVTTAPLSAGQSRALQWLASLVLMLSYVPMLKAWGAGTGFALWVGVVSVTAVVVMLLLSYRPRLSIKLAYALMVISTVTYAMLWLQYQP